MVHCASVFGEPRHSERGRPSRQRYPRLLANAWVLLHCRADRKVETNYLNHKGCCRLPESDLHDKTDQVEVDVWFNGSTSG